MSESDLLTQGMCCECSRAVSEGFWCIWLVLVQSANLIGHHLNLIGQLILVGQAICKTTDMSPLEPGVFAPCLVAVGSHKRLTGYVRYALGFILFSE